MNARVADIMNPKLLYILAGDRLALARSKILEFGVTAVPILDDEHRPVGVVSLRDFSQTDGVVKATEPARVVRDDATIPEAARVLADYGVHHLVVVDARGIAVGMVSALDFVRAFAGLEAKHPTAFAAF